MLSFLLHRLMSTSPQPKAKMILPGSAEAIIRGCSCPVGLNDSGKGVYNVPSRQVSLAFIHLNCPVHGIQQIKQTCKVYNFDESSIIKTKVS